MKNKLLELEAKDLNISNISNIKKIYQDRKIKKILLIQPPDTNAATSIIQQERGLDCIITHHMVLVF